MIPLAFLASGLLAAAGAVAWHARARCSIPLAIVACGLWAAGVGLFYLMARSRIR